MKIYTTFIFLFDLLFNEKKNEDQKSEHDSLLLHNEIDSISQ